MSTAGPGAAMRTGALQRAIRRGRSRPAGEACAVCAAPVGPSHRHLYAIEQGVPVCACPACALLFDRPEASGARYRSIPDRRARLEGLPQGRLGVPVGLAFFVLDGRGGVDAHYPSPAGATRWAVEPSAWQAIVGACPPLEALEPKVEALLVNATAAAAPAAWIVPITDCYDLVGIVRRTWTGMSGGDLMKAEIAAFFRRLDTEEA